MPTSVTELSEYVRRKSCARRFKLGQIREQVRNELPFYGKLLNTLDPETQRVGRLREDQLKEYLEQNDYVEIPRPQEAWTLEQLTSVAENLEPGRNYFAREVSLNGLLGAFELVGRLDYLLLTHIAGSYALRIVEVKMSRKDQTYHRIQVAAYQLLLGNLLKDLEFSVGGLQIVANNIEGIVARVDEETGNLQPILELAPIDLELERTDVERLLADGGALARIAGTPITELPYELSSKCDNCVFTVYCLPEAARLRDVELTGAGPSALRALRDAGVTTIDALANLSMASDVAGAVRINPAFNENLARLIQTARVRRATLPRIDEAAPPITPEEDNAMLARARQTFTALGTINVYNDARYSLWLHSLRERYRLGTLSAELMNAMAEMRFPWAPQVARLPHGGASQMPPYEIDGRPLVRVYLTIHFDYVEHRIGAIAAHVTTSSRRLVTRFHQVDRDGALKFEPLPGIYELPTDADPFRSPPDAYQELSGRNVIQYKVGPWSTRFEDAVASERELLQQFFHTLVTALGEVAQQPRACVHFYLWSPTEMQQLVDACARTDSQLLSSLRELLGCREPLEQIIYSSVGTQVRTNYALGWTSGGLVVATSLKWSGSYHWTRMVAGETVKLDWVFRQDLFDFKTTLDITADGKWDTDEDPEPDDDGAVEQVTRSYFEIRSRFFDSLSPPYWRALWRTLVVPEDATDARLRAQVARYYESAHPGYMDAYLAARCHALRWVEERLPKNDELTKAELDLRAIRQFNLGVDTTRRAALDFLQLEQFIKATNWITDCLAPPSVRVASGRAIPLTRLVATAANRLTGWIDLNGFECDLPALAARCSFAEESFVRMSPCFEDPERSQTIRQLFNGGSTATIDLINWDTGEVHLSVIPSVAQGGPELFILFSLSRREGDELPTHVMLDESPSDFVAQRVHRRLTNEVRSQVYEWFHPEQPRIPVAPALPAAQRAEIEEAVVQVVLPDQQRLEKDQRDAIMAGIDARIQLLQGPPGTGKSTTLGIAIHARIAARAGARDLVAIVANTHTAVDGLLNKVVSTADAFSNALNQRGLRLPSTTFFRLEPKDPLQAPVIALDPSAAIQALQRAMRAGVSIVAGTTSQLLKLQQSTSRSAAFTRDSGGLILKDLIVDEASMMLLPHFLSIASMLRHDGCCLLAGDHRQLSPIVSHDWVREERPPIQIYQPYVSAYEAVQRVGLFLGDNPGRIVRSALNYSFRLPDLIRELIAPLYRRDNIALDGRTGGERVADFADAPFQALWNPGVQLVLVVHNEAASSRANPYEAALIREIVGACDVLRDDSIGVVTPHRAQRVLLIQSLAEYGDAVSPIDTVERLQGGERPTIVVSGTVSDPAVISRNAEFILNLNRANVAFSRAQERLIVVCSESLLDAVPPDFEQYQSAFLWKGIRQFCSQQVAEFEFQQQLIRFFVPPLDFVRNPE